MKKSVLGQNLKSLRQKHNLTQKELSTALKISRQTLSYYECGEREPDIDMLIDISTYFNCSIDSLLKNYNEFVIDTKIKDISNKNKFEIEELIIYLQNKKQDFEKSISDIEFIIKNIKK